MSYQKAKQQGTAYDSLIRAEAKKNGINPELFHKLIWVESRFDPKAKSPTGASGIAQFVKATGKAYGLSPEDRFDPMKAIPAAARHLKDLYASLDGDEALVALAYNQGLGRAGRKQVEAVKQGRMDLVSKEGAKYMSLLQDSFNPEQAGRYKLDSAPLEKPVAAPAGKPEVGAQGVAPKAASFQGSQEGQSFTRETTFDEKRQAAGLEYGFDKQSAGTFSGSGQAIVDGFSTSTIGSAMRAASISGSFDTVRDFLSPQSHSDYQLDEEDYEAIRSKGLKGSYVDQLNRASSKESFNELLTLAEHSQFLEEQKNSRGTGAQLISSVGEAAGDPLSLMPILGQAGRGYKLVSTAAAKRAASVGLQTGAAAGAGELLRSELVGGDTDIAMAIAGGALLGGAFSMAGNMFKPKDVDAIGRGISRLEDVESSRNLGIDTAAKDMKVFGDDTIELKVTEGGVEYKYNPVGDGSVILSDGSIISSYNPMHPKFREVYRANAGLSVGGFTEAGLAALRSKDPVMSQLASDMYRSPTKLQDGSSGKFEATISDIIDQEASLNRSMLNDMQSAFHEAAKDPMWKGFDDMDVKEGLYMRVTKAIEKPEKYLSQLTDAEIKLRDSLLKISDEKLDNMLNPWKYGRNEGVRPILEKTDHEGAYIPRVYDDAKRSAQVDRFGSPEGLQKAVQQNMLAQAKANPAIKAKALNAAMARYKLDSKKGTTADSKLPDENELLERYTNDIAYGIAQKSEFSYGAATSDALDNTGKGIETNNFLEARHPFDSDFELKLPEGNFKMDDLRSFRLDQIMPSYMKRTDGHVAVMGAAGRTVDEYKAELNATGYATHKDGQFRQEGEAIMNGLHRALGFTNRKSDNAFDTALRSLTNLSFAAKNANMAIQNLTEVAGLVAKGHTTALLHGIPMLRKLKGGAMAKDPEGVKELHKIIYGKDLDDAIRPTRQDVREIVRAGTSVPSWAANALADARFFTGELAARMPTTKALTFASNYIADAGRMGFLSDFVDSVHTGGKDIPDNLLNSMSITKEQYAAVKDLIKNETKFNADGSLWINPKIRTFPAAGHLFRIGDQMANDAIQRTMGLSNQSVEMKGALFQMMMQFKSFVTRGVNNKAIRNWHEATKNDRFLEKTTEQAVAMGLAVAYYAARQNLNMVGMSDADRAEYANIYLDDDMLAVAALTRSTGIGSVGGLAGIVAGGFGYEPARAVRTSIAPTSKSDREARAQNWADPSVLAKGILEQVPAASFGANAVESARNAVGWAGAGSIGEALDYKTAFYNTFRNVIPNDPISQYGLRLFLENAGGDAAGLLDK